MHPPELQDTLTAHGGPGNCVYFQRLAVYHILNDFLCFPAQAVLMLCNFYLCQFVPLHSHLHFHGNRPGRIFAETGSICNLLQIRIADRNLLHAVNHRP